MQKNSTFYWLIFCLFSTLKFHAQSGHVLYGEREQKSTNTAIFFDKEGFLYPNYFISDSSLDSCNSSLRNWYSAHQRSFLTISKAYNCSFSMFNAENCSTLNDSIAAYYSTEINRIKHEYTSVTFLIHGFRKSFDAQNGDISSPLSFQNLKKSIIEIQPSNTNFVEIYWDGMYDCCFSASAKNNQPLFQLYLKAQENAALVGQSFKKILTSMHYDTIHIFSHSLGAKVALHALLDIENNNSPTPSNQNINICLIAPAISADLIDQHYYQRHSSCDYKSKDNYRLVIIYNEKDFALRKKDNKLLLFGPGPYEYGNTSLGCNYKNAAFLLKEDFLVKFTNSPLEILDFSAIGKQHHLENYCSSEKWEVLLRTIYK